MEENKKIKSFTEYKRATAWLLAFLLVFPPYFVIFSPRVFAQIREMVEEIGTLLPDSEKYAFAGIDAESGLSEVFFFNGDNNLRITSNGVTDGNAQYDEFSNKIVYQSLVDNIWQIFLYDVATNTSVQISIEGSNNVDPKISNGQVIWRSWLDGNWEIYTYDGLTSERLTFDQDHDIDPQISNGYLVWRSYETDQLGGSKDEVRSENYEIEMFDIKTRENKKLTNDKRFNDQLSVEYPYIIWQTEDEEGDKEVMSHDISKAVTSRITDNNFDDVAPKIKNGRLKWYENIKMEVVENNVEDGNGPKKLLVQPTWLDDPGGLCPTQKTVCAYNHEEKKFLNYINECYAIKFDSPIAHEGKCDGNEIPPVDEVVEVVSPSLSFEEITPTSSVEPGTYENEGSFDEDGNVLIEETVPVEFNNNEETANEATPLVEDAEEPVVFEESAIMQIGEAINDAITTTASTTAEIFTNILPGSSEEPTLEATPEVTPEQAEQSPENIESITETEVIE